MLTSDITVGVLTIHVMFCLLSWLYKSM